MADPFQDVDAAGEDFIQIFADSMDERQSDPTMERIVAEYLGQLEIDDDSILIEVGAGAGAVSRRIAKFAHPAQVIGYDSSVGFVEHAKARAAGYTNLSFAVADGAALPLADESVDNVVFHTVLTHVPQPELLIAEARRVLKPKGRLVICDMDFSKATLGNFAHDPLDACAKAFVREFVTDPFIAAKLRPLILAAGLELGKFDVQSRVVAASAQMMPWVMVTTKNMVERGDIGAPLAAALVDEYSRRIAQGRLYGYQAVAVAIAQKP